MKKLTGTFLFEEDYSSNDYHTIIKQKAQVKLLVNYIENKFSIQVDGGGNQPFLLEDSNKWKEWKAILACVDKAIDFGNMEVGNVKREMPKEK